MHGFIGMEGFVLMDSTVVVVVVIGYSSRSHTCCGFFVTFGVLDLLTSEE